MVLPQKLSANKGHTAVKRRPDTPEVELVLFVFVWYLQLFRFTKVLASFSLQICCC